MLLLLLLLLLVLPLPVVIDRAGGKSGMAGEVEEEPERVFLVVDALLEALITAVLIGWRAA